VLNDDIEPTSNPRKILISTSCSIPLVSIVLCFPPLKLRYSVPLLRRDKRDTPERLLSPAPVRPCNQNLIKGVSSGETLLIHHH
jgi:hypothetical protein